jgi:hypothetical protein
MSMAGKQMKTQNMPTKTEHAKIQLRAGPPALFILKSLYTYIYTLTTHALCTSALGYF